MGDGRGGDGRWWIVDGRWKIAISLLEPPTAAAPMKKKIKPLRAALGCAGLSVLGVILLGFLGLQALFFVTGKTHSGKSTTGLGALAVENLVVGVLFGWR